MEIVDGFKALVNYILLPCFAGLLFFVRKHISRIEDLEKRAIESEKDLAVMESQMSDIRRDIDEIKAGIQKLVDKLCRP